LRVRCISCVRFTYKATVYLWRIMTPVILFRKLSRGDEQELAVARKYFPVYENRASIPNKSLVIGRYSVLPFHRELELDLAERGCSMIGDTTAHRSIADIRCWAHVLDTFPTWFRMEDVPDDAYPVIIKGSTNSRKNKWAEMMWCPDKVTMIANYIKHQQDGFFDGQEIYIRKYVPLYRYMTDDISGLPITHEIRYFVLDGHIIDSGFYWQNHIDDILAKGLTSSDGSAMVALRPGMEWLQKQIDAVCDTIGDAFVVLDVGLGEDGRWHVIELNDGCMSGLSCIEPDSFYSKLSKHFDTMATRGPHGP
jgi:hypothetical protein